MKLSKVWNLHISLQQNKDLPIYGIKSKDLRGYTTTDRDIERGRSRIPDKSVFVSLPIYLAANWWRKRDKCTYKYVQRTNILEDGLVVEETKEEDIYDMCGE